MAIDPADLKRLHAQAYSWALTCVHGNAAEAEDVLQMTYLAILEGKARFDGRSALRTWLFAVIRTTARSVWRRTRYRWLPLDPPNDEPNPARDAESKDERAQVLAAWRSLPARQREILDLMFYREVSVTEAAEIMGISVGSARQHYDRAKSALRARLLKAQ